MWWLLSLMFVGFAWALVGWVGVYLLASRRPGLVLATEEWQQVRHALAGRVS
jgi:hypothetical protein